MLPSDQHRALLFLVATRKDAVTVVLGPEEEGLKVGEAAFGPGVHVLALPGRVLDLAVKVPHEEASVLP